MNLSRFITPAMWCFLVQILLAGKSYGQNQADTTINHTHFISEFRDGFKDTFTLKGYHFRITADIKNEYESYTYVMQRLEGKQWINQFSFGYGASLHQPEYDRSNDYNKDGYNDIVCYSRHETDGYMFDTLHGSFVKSTTSPPYQWKLIDTARNLFCSLDFNLKDDYGISLLYTYKNLQIYPYYYLKIEDNDDQSKKLLTLYRCVNGDTENLKQIMHTDMDTDNYDFYEGFWKLCYKGLHY